MSLERSILVHTERECWVLLGGNTTGKENVLRKEYFGTYREEKRTSERIPSSGTS